MNGIFKQVSLWIILLIIVLLALTTMTDRGDSKVKLGSQDFVAQLENQNLKEVKISRIPDELYKYEVTFKQPVEEQSSMEFNYPDIPNDWREAMWAQGLDPDPKQENNYLMGFLFQFVPIILIIGFFWFRFFDILKPLGVRKLEQLGGGGGVGIMADDIGAGVQACLATHGTLWLLARYVG